MPKRDITLYIVDVFIAIDKIKRFTEKFSNATDFLHSELEWDATIRELQIIGDATNILLNENLIGKSFRRIVDFRNQIVHVYFGIDEEIVWEVITQKLNVFQEELLTITALKKIDLNSAIIFAKEENIYNDNITILLSDLQKILK